MIIGKLKNRILTFDLVFAKIMVNTRARSNRNVADLPISKTILLIGKIVSPHFKPLQIKV